MERKKSFINRFRRSRLAQVWYTDFVVAVLIFVTILILYFAYTEYSNDFGNDVISEMVLDSKYMSSSLMSAGYPPDWTAANVVRIGLTDNNYRLNKTKLDRFAQVDYNSSRTIFGTQYHYYFYVEYQNNGSRVMAGASDHLGIEPDDEHFLAQTTRMLIYDREIVNMVIHLWR